MDSQKKFTNIDEYIEIFNPEVQKILKKIRETLKEVAPEAIETISYQMPTLKIKGKNLVHFAAWKNHIGFYPTPSAIEVFEKELSPYQPAKGSIQFPLEKPIPYDLIKKIVLLRLNQLTQ